MLARISIFGASEFQQNASSHKKHHALVQTSSRMEGAGGVQPPDIGFATSGVALGVADHETERVSEGNIAGPAKTTSPRKVFVSAVVSLTMTAVGSVVLSLPRAFAECGILGAICALALFAALTDASLTIIAGAAVSVNAETYEQTVKAVCGRKAQIVLKSCLTCLLFGTLVSLQIIAADLVAPVVEEVMYGDKPGLLSSRLIINSCVFLLVYPLSLLNDVKNLATAGASAFVVLSLVAFTLCVRFVKAGLPIVDDVVWIGDSPLLVALALPVVSLSYTCHFNVVEIGREYLQSSSFVTEDASNARTAPNGVTTNVTPSSTKSVTSIIRTMIWGFAFPFYILFALVGYLGFGSRVSGDLLTEWIGDGEMSVAQIAVALVNVLKYPLMGFALRGIVVEAVEEWWLKGNGGGGEENANDGRIYDPLLDDDDACSVETSTNDSQKHRYASPFIVRALALCILHATIALCAVVLRELSLVLDLIGSTCGVTVAFIVPGWVLLRSGGLTGMRWAHAKNVRRLPDTVEDTMEDLSDVSGNILLSAKVLAWVLIGVGGVTSVCGIAAVVTEIV